MRRTPPTKRPRRQARSLPDCLRQFLTPAVWKQARRHLPTPRRTPRWSFHHLVLVLLAMTWALGQSNPERFEMARGIVWLCRPKRRRAGRTAAGFQKAVARLPLRPLVALAAAVRGRMACVLAPSWRVAGFVPLGCDGSRLECPRTDELGARLGRAAQSASAPAVWVTALVHLTTGVPWSWRLGKGDASERDHLRRLVPTLPADALVVTDAGFDGYDLAAALMAAPTSFLIRMSSKVHLLTEQPVRKGCFHDGPVLCWPRPARRANRPPLRLRLIALRPRRRPSGKRPAEIWLLTHVCDPGRLSRDQAARFYRLRWENEGLFRTYKRTLGKVRLVGRTVRSVHREAYGSLLACQLLLAQGAWAMQQRRTAAAPAPPPCSARQALVVIRQELDAAPRPRRRGSFRERLGGCVRERRRRGRPKEKHAWPQRTPHKPPKPPRLRTLNEREKALIQRGFTVA